VHVRCEEAADCHDPHSPQCCRSGHQGKCIAALRFAAGSALSEPFICFTFVALMDLLRWLRAGKCSSPYGYQIDNFDASLTRMVKYVLPFPLCIFVTLWQVHAEQSAGALLPRRVVADVTAYTSALCIHVHNNKVVTHRGLAGVHWQRGECSAYLVQQVGSADAHVHGKGQQRSEVEFVARASLPALFMMLWPGGNKWRKRAWRHRQSKAMRCLTRCIPMRSCSTENPFQVVGTVFRHDKEDCDARLHCH
jgi:hypothetical protein